MRLLGAAAVGTALMAVTAACGSAGPPAPSAGPPGVASTTVTEQAEPSDPPMPRRPARRPLAGRVVVIDPGHQLGNHNFPAQVRAPVDAGGFEKPCNTTGTQTDAGYPEATFAWRVAQDVRRMLRRQGARVVLTRTSNSESAWGPCVDRRGRFGNPGGPGPTADLKLSIHADGTYAAGAHGFHVIAPGVAGLGGRPRLERRDVALTRLVRDSMVAAGFATSTYLGVRGMVVRNDLGTLNWSRIPAAMIECGNMRDAGDAAVLTSARGQHRIARALAAAVGDYLQR
ncbi:N-acetylmuramoyl-L-alanine amidase family protein [Nocardioides ultimimeridianus]